MYQIYIDVSNVMLQRVSGLHSASHHFYKVGYSKKYDMYNVQLA
jgi:hypothetical protein